MQWHYAIDDETKGPISEAEFARLVERGVIAGETLVWHQGMPEWQSLVEVLGSLPLPIPSPVPDRVLPGLGGEVRRVPGPFGYGGLWPRAAARLIDAAIVAVLGGLVQWMLGNIVGSVFASLPYVDLMIPEIQYLADMVLILAYGEIFIRLYDATPGKMAMGLKLLRSDGQKVRSGRFLGREWAVGLSLALLGLGGLMIAFDGERRALHDRLCDTRVIRTR